MSTSIKIVGTSEQSAWTTAVVLLAVERVAPLLGLLGVPVIMTDNPDELQTSFRRVAEAGLGSWSGLSYNPTELSAKLNSEFDKMAREYGDEATSSLISWITMHFLVEDRFNWLSDCHLVFSLYASHLAIPREDVIAISITESTQRIFDEIINRMFSRKQAAEIDNALEKLESTPPSPLELTIAKLGHTEDLESDYSHMDIVAHVASHVSVERAARVWNELKATVSDEDIRALERWIGPQYQSFIG
jgi:hypothetical protein